MNAAGPVIHIEPLVRWPKTMVRAEPHLVEVDLRLADEKAEWPYEDEEFSFRVLLAGKPFYLVETVDDSQVTLHRFGGSYGPCRFVVTPECELGEHPLGLSLETEGGAHVVTTALPVQIAESGPVRTEALTQLPVVPSINRVAAEPGPHGDRWRKAGVDTDQMLVSLALIPGQDTGAEIVAAACGLNPRHTQRATRVLLAEGILRETSHAGRFVLASHYHNRAYELRRDFSSEKLRAAAKRIVDGYVYLGRTAMEILAPHSTAVDDEHQNQRERWRTVVGRMPCQDWMRIEQAGLEGVAVLAASHRLWDGMNALSEVLHWYYKTRRSWARDLDLQTRLIDIADRNVSARLMTRRAEALSELGQRLGASESYSEAIAILRHRLADEPSTSARLELASTLTKYGLLRIELGHTSEAQRWHLEALTIHHALVDEASDDSALAEALTNMANSYALMGRYHQAWSCLTDARAIFENLGDDTGQAQVAELLTGMSGSMAESEDQEPTAATGTSTPEKVDEPGMVLARLEAAMVRTRSDDPVDQLTGFAALASLAQETAGPSLRQEIADTICAYLRPGSSTEEDIEPDSGISVTDVRETVVNLLAQLLRGRDVYGDGAEANSATRTAADDPLNVDLTGAALPDIDFSSCTFGDTCFDDVTFSGEASFNSAQFAGRLHARRAVFRAPAAFNSAVFRKSADFQQAIFASEVRFDSATFFEDTNFDDVDFRALASFSSVRIHRTFSLRDSLLDARAMLETVDLGEHATTRLGTGWDIHQDERGLTTIVRPGWDRRGGSEAATHTESAPRSTRTAVTPVPEPTGTGVDPSLAKLIAEHSPIMWRIARASGLPIGEAEDVVQSVWATLMQHPESLADTRIPGWLAIETRRVARRMLRRREGPISVSPSWFYEVEDIVATAEVDGIADSVDKEQRRRVLWRAIRSMSPQCRQLITTLLSTGFERVDYAELASTLGIPRSKIGPARGRCLQQLRQRLESDPTWARRFTDSD